MSLTASSRRMESCNPGQAEPEIDQSERRPRDSRTNSRDITFRAALFRSPPSTRIYPTGDLM